MSVIRRCDRCGAEISDADDYTVVNVNYRDTCGPQPKDLCGHCSNDLKLFLNKNWPLSPTQKSPV
jgi:hypothetical protein